MESMALIAPTRKFLCDPSSQGGGLSVLLPPGFVYWLLCWSKKQNPHQPRKTSASTPRYNVPLENISRQAERRCSVTKRCIKHTNYRGVQSRPFACVTQHCKKMRLKYARSISCKDGLGQENSSPARHTPAKARHLYARRCVVRRNSIYVTRHEYVRF